MPDEHQTNEATRPGADSAPSWLAWVRLLLAVAILGAGYLAWVAISHGPVAGCGPGSSCDKVLQSRWAYWLNVPVSIPALLVYLALLGATVLLQKRPSPDEQRGTWVGIIGLSVIVAGAAAWFVGLQMFIIEAFCKFCLTAHACGFAAAVLLLRHIPLAVDPDTPMWATGSGKTGIPRKAVAPLVMTGVAGVLVLVAGQLLVQKERNLVKVFPQAGTNAPKPVSATTSRPPPNSPNAHLAAPHLLSLYNGQFLLPLDDVPMIGSPGASNVIVNLFDYNCTHCRMLHPILLGTQWRLSNQLGIVCLPVPMSTNCNPLVPVGRPSFTNSCDYARLGLAVWRADRRAYPRFQNRLFFGERPPSVEQAREYAAQLVGGDALQTALTNEWIQQQILTACYLHYTNWQSTGGPAMPQIIIGSAISVGPLNSVNHLLALLEKYLGIEPPPLPQPPIQGKMN